MAKSLVISSDLKAARKLERRLLREVDRYGYSEAATFAIKLALEEGLNNAIKHGNRWDPTKVIEVDFEINREQVAFTISDQGDGFDPGSVPDPTADENLEKPTGRGIMLMRAYMDEVTFGARGNEVRMVKRNTHQERCHGTNQQVG